MKFSDRKELNRHIKIGIPLPVYVIYGSEGLLKKKALDQIISMVTGGDEYALSRLPGDTPVLTIATDLYELSFSGADRKSVV